MNKEIKIKLIDVDKIMNSPISEAANFIFKTIEEAEQSLKADQTNQIIYCFNKDKFDEINSKTQKEIITDIENSKISTLWLTELNYTKKQNSIPLVLINSHNYKTKEDLVCKWKKWIEENSLNNEFLYEGYSFDRKINLKNKILDCFNLFYY